MPIYRWKDQNTDYEIEVFKESFDQAQEPPAESDLPEAERGKDRKWLKLISKGIKVARGNSWSGSKGNW